MAEASIDNYVWLCDQLDIPVTGSEIAGGRIQTRKDWIRRGACDFALRACWTSAASARW